MNRPLQIGLLLVGLGFVILFAAPFAQSCIEWSDGRACETIGTIVFNVLGTGLMALGTVVAIIGVRHKISV